jgi:hypothetical protein
MAKYSLVIRDVAGSTQPTVNMDVDGEERDDTPSKSIFIVTAMLMTVLNSRHRESTVGMLHEAYKLVKLEEENNSSSLH